MDWRTFKANCKKAYVWLKEDKSVWSWLANLAIAFVVIKFIIYPVLGLVFSTSLPVVAVVSSSMDHSAIDGTICGVQAPPSYSADFDSYWQVCGSWYEQRNITKDMFKKFSFVNGFKKGDIMVLFGKTTIKQGDIVVYQADAAYPIIHRVWNLSATTVSTKGDHNPAPIQQYALIQDGIAYQCELGGQAMACIFGGRPVTKNTAGATALIDETNVPRSSIIGEAVFRIPWLGYVKIWFTDIVQWAVGLFH